MGPQQNFSQSHRKLELDDPWSCHTLGEPKRGLDFMPLESRQNLGPLSCLQSGQSVLGMRLSHNSVPKREEESRPWDT